MKKNNSNLGTLHFYNRIVTWCIGLWTLVGLGLAWAGIISIDMALVVWFLLVLIRFFLNTAEETSEKYPRKEIKKIKWRLPLIVIIIVVAWHLLYYDFLSWVMELDEDTKSEHVPAYYRQFKEYFK